MDGCERRKEEMSLSLIKAQVYGLEELQTKTTIKSLLHLVVGTIASWIKSQYVGMMFAWI